MNKEVVLGFISNLTSDEFMWLYRKLKDRYSGELAEAINFMSENKEMDNFLSLADTAEELYDRVDFIRDVMEEKKNMYKK